MKQGFFISFGVRVTLRFLVSIKKFGQYKKFPSEKFVTKKRTFRKTFRSTQKFLELQCLLDDFRITNVCQCFFTLNILLDAHLLRINIVTMCKKRRQSVSSREQIFYCKQRSRFICRYLMLKKSLTRFITVNIPNIRTIIS